MQKRTIVCLGIATTLCASVAFAEELFVQSESVSIRSGHSGLYPVTATREKGSALTVVGHEGRWIKVQSDGVEGYVFEGAVAAEKPGFDVMSHLTAKTTVTEGAAAKGLGPTATTYAQGKNLSTKPLDDLIAFRKQIDPKEWEAFCAAGKVGPAKP